MKQESPTAKPTPAAGTSPTPAQIHQPPEQQEKEVELLQRTTAVPTQNIFKRFINNVINAIKRFWNWISGSDKTQSTSKTAPSKTIISNKHELSVLIQKLEYYELKQFIGHSEIQKIIREARELDSQYSAKQSNADYSQMSGAYQVFINRINTLTTMQKRPSESTGRSFDDIETEAAIEIAKAHNLLTDTAISQPQRNALLSLRKEIQDALLINDVATLERASKDLKKEVTQLVLILPSQKADQERFLSGWNARRPLTRKELQEQTNRLKEKSEEEGFNTTTSPTKK